MELIKNLDVPDEYRPNYIYWAVRNFWSVHEIISLLHNICPYKYDKFTARNSIIINIDPIYDLLKESKIITDQGFDKLEIVSYLVQFKINFPKELTNAFQTKPIDYKKMYEEANKTTSENIAFTKADAANVGRINKSNDFRELFIDRLVNEQECENWKDEVDFIFKQSELADYTQLKDTTHQLPKSTYDFLKLLRNRMKEKYNN